ncbi:MAG TPA: hypothetical protein VMN36_03990 [Verrucomicrobiales bacterium]|nr:hypothetical protein [Verrucomicrobiales bacterium]
MKELTRTLFILTASVLAAFAEKPTTENKDWEKACGGSNIAVTSIAGNIVSIDAFVEHFTEGRQWQCHFKDGKIVSALYRHFTVTRKAAGDAGEFMTELDEDRVEVFHFPDHEISEMDPALEKDLLEVIAIATNKGGAHQPATRPDSE